MPVFPLNVVEWPGNEVRLNIIEPAYRKMYDDILVSGTRRFLMPFSPCVRGFPRGRVRFPEMAPEDRRLHAVAPILYLEDLREVSAQTDDAVKYQVKHSVVGFARMKRLLNPSALFRTNDDGWKVNYLRAEVELLEEAPDAALRSDAADELSEAWEELRQISERTGEPQLQQVRIRLLAATSQTWRLADVWQQLQSALQSHRDQVRVFTSVRSWIEAQQEQGLLPDDLPDQLNAADINLPADLLESLQQLQSPHGLPLDDDFWEPLLRLQAAGDAAARGELLVASARNEVRLARAREALRTI